MSSMTLLTKIILALVGLALLITSAFGLGYYLGSPKLGRPQAQPVDEVKDRPGRGLVRQPGGDLKYHTAYYATSVDGQTWQPGGLVQKEASVPDVVELTSDLGDFRKGDLLVYFVDAANFTGPNTESLGLIVSSDGGKTWGKKQTTQVKNKVNKGAPVDPSVVQLPDGRLRLYYFGSQATAGDPASAAGQHKVYSALSADGLNFETEPADRLADERLTDPEVINYNNQWYMYYSVGPKSKLAISDDGLTFRSKPITGGEVGGVPGALVTSDGGVRLFGCSQGGFSSAISSDGVNFTFEQSNVVEGATCDPAAIKRSNGQYFMIYKVVEKSS